MAFFRGRATRGGRALWCGWDNRELIMSDDTLSLSRSQAGERFRQAHIQAIRQDWVDRITGRNPDLFSYEEVRSILQAREGADLPKRQEVPLDKIVGSVGRYRDFTRAFLPRNEALEDRWRRVSAIKEGPTGLPPVELYQVGDVYFVRDGNHRISVARANGDKSIEANVRLVDAPIPVEADSAEALDEWLIEVGQRLFLEKTKIKDYYPDCDIRLTEPGRYRQLREQIDVHRWYLGERLGREASYEETVRSWCEQVYLPLAREIQKSGVMKDFPNRTVADLFLWISHHREELRAQYNLDLDEKAAVSTFASVYSDKPLSKAIKSARLAVARMAAGDDVIVGLPKEEETGKPVY